MAGAPILLATGKCWPFSFAAFSLPNFIFYFRYYEPSELPAFGGQAVAISCKYCQTTFRYPCQLYRHNPKPYKACRRKIVTPNIEIRYKCLYCPGRRTFAQKFTLTKHLFRCHDLQQMINEGYPFQNHTSTW